MARLLSRPVALGLRKRLDESLSLPFGAPAGQGFFRHEKAPAALVATAYTVCTDYSRCMRQEFVPTTINQACHARTVRQYIQYRMEYILDTVLVHQAVQFFRSMIKPDHSMTIFKKNLPLWLERLRRHPSRIDDGLVLLVAYYRSYPCLPQSDRPFVGNPSETD